MLRHPFQTALLKHFDIFPTQREGIAILFYSFISPLGHNIAIWQYKLTEKGLLGVDLSQIKGKIVTTFWYIGHFFPKIYVLF